MVVVLRRRPQPLVAAVLVEFGDPVLVDVVLVRRLQALAEDHYQEEHRVPKEDLEDHVLTIVLQVVLVVLAVQVLQVFLGLLVFLWHQAVLVVLVVLVVLLGLLADLVFLAVLVLQVLLVVLVLLVVRLHLHLRQSQSF